MIESSQLTLQPRLITNILNNYYHLCSDFTFIISKYRLICNLFVEYNSVNLKRYVSTDYQLLQEYLKYLQKTEKSGSKPGDF